MPPANVPAASSQGAAQVAKPLVWVVCLCAAWCKLCADYREVFERVAERYPALHFVWLDIEDEAAWLGELDVETFPTLMLADTQAIRFLGPVPPQAGQLQRLVDAVQADTPRTVQAPELAVLLQHLRQTQPPLS